MRFSLLPNLLKPHLQRRFFGLAPSNTLIDEAVLYFLERKNYSRAIGVMKERHVNTLRVFQPLEPILSQNDFMRTISEIFVWSMSEKEPNWEIAHEALLLIPLNQLRGSFLSFVEASVQHQISNNRVAESLTLLENMASLQLPIPENIFDWVLRGCVTKCDATGALRVFDLMRQEGKTPSPLGFYLLLELFSRLNQTDGIKFTLDQARTRHQLPPSSVFHFIIRGYILCGQVQKAAALMDAALTQHQDNISTDTCYLLLTACAKRGLTELLNELVVRFYARNIFLPHHRRLRLQKLLRFALTEKERLNP
eukprot:TRINITY_DN7597_c0_g1_i2.p1 TRINITY_DN7597_c0_g1~~TRINITY_DN7597_c0_g1_i2.p1  ORF type:complete len:309 (-),score=38.46 TRINITY_DN7597_c0_g1_i2:29-955(-)